MEILAHNRCSSILVAALELVNEQGLAHEHIE
jgi:hypothetical protein